MIRSGMVAFHADLQPLMQPIDTVEQHPDNYNCGDVELIAHSIEINGMYRPIGVQKSTNYIVMGNHTWLACKMLDAETIPVVYLDVDDDTALRMMIDDNESAKRAQTDRGQLLNILDRLNANSYLPATIAPQDVEVLRKLNEIPVDHDEYAQWPTITVQVPPHVRHAYYKMTEAAVGDRERFELLLRLAGWDGK